LRVMNFFLFIGLGFIFHDGGFHTIKYVHSGIIEIRAAEMDGRIFFHKRLRGRNLLKCVYRLAKRMPARKL
jgi:hypothetical protein